MRRTWWYGSLVVAMLVASPATARGDATAFLGVSPTPESRMARGLSLGFGLLIVGFEAEYATIDEQVTDLLPGLTTGMGNVLVQTPLSGFQVYGTAGAGVYREELGGRTESDVAVNLGGGAKITIAGPLRLRLDYRVVRLRGAPLHETYQRFYAGANLAF